MRFIEILHPWMVRKNEIPGGAAYLHDSLARDSGLSEKAALDITVGRREPRWDEAIRIAGAFGLTLAQFIEGARGFPEEYTLGSDGRKIIATAPSPEEEKPVTAGPARPRETIRPGRKQKPDHPWRHRQCSSTD